MKNVIARNKKEIEQYRNKIFKSKAECRKIFARLPFDRKIEIANNLYKFAIEFKKSKIIRID